MVLEGKISWRGSSRDGEKKDKDTHQIVALGAMIQQASWESVEELQEDAPLCGSRRLNRLGYVRMMRRAPVP